MPIGSFWMFWYVWIIFFRLLWGLRFAKPFYCQFLKINESALRWQRSLWWTPRGQQFNRFQGELIIHLAHIIFESHRDHQITHFTVVLRDFPCNSALPLLSSLPTLLFAYQKSIISSARMDYYSKSLRHLHHHHLLGCTLWKRNCFHHHPSRSLRSKSRSSSRRKVRSGRYGCWGPTQKK